MDPNDVNSLENDKESLRLDKRSAVLRNAISGAVVAGVFLAFLCILAIIQVKDNEESTRNTATVLMDQVKTVISHSESEQETTLLSIQDTCVARAKAAAYVLEFNTEIEEDADSLHDLAELMQADEISIFDRTGTIIYSTVEDYVGLNMDDGEQIGFFKPMLLSTSMTLCQNLTANTAMGTVMMYAAVWKQDGSEIVQIGVREDTIQGELQEYAIAEIIDDMPSYDGMSVIVAEWGTQKIVGATDSSLIGSRLDDMDISDSDYVKNTMSFYQKKIDGVKKYLAIEQYGSYIIALTQDRSAANDGMSLVMYIVTLYLIIAGGVIVTVSGRLYKKLGKELKQRILQEQLAKRFQEDADSDKMTGLANRRVYERDLARIRIAVPDPKLVYVSLDLNCLKATNDTLGHEAGDELIKAAADLLNRVFGEYGSVYRNGGDEFAAIFSADTDVTEYLKVKLKADAAVWTGLLVKSLDISAGYASAEEFPEAGIDELAKIADKRMYADKDAFYRDKGIDRRGTRVAYDLISATYVRILRVNMTTDTFTTVKLGADEKPDANGSGRLTEYLMQFASEGNVSKDTYESFIKLAEPGYLREHFRHRGKQLAVMFRMRGSRGFITSLIEFLPDKDYSRNNEIVYMCIRHIET